MQCVQWFRKLMVAHRIVVLLVVLISMSNPCILNGSRVLLGFRHFV